MASLSRGAYDTLKADAMFSFFRHAFLELGTAVEGEQLGEFDGRPVAEYADTLVMDLLVLDQLNADSEAILVLNVWMYVVHQLYEILRACKRNDQQSVADMNAALDIAAALWIGVGQLQGDNDSGNMLYNLAEVAGARFDQDRGETEVNRLVIDALNALKLGINFGTCSNDTTNGYIEFHIIIRQTIGRMTIPLVQILIHHIMQEPTTERSIFIQLYALSVAPRVEACNPTAYRDMLTMFVRRNFDPSERTVALALLQSIYTCLEVTCSEVGTYGAGVEASCRDGMESPPIYASYSSSHEEVLPVSLSFCVGGADCGYRWLICAFESFQYGKFDRDILQIKILTKARAYRAALDYYQYGYNVKTGELLATLRGLAVSRTRSIAASQFGLFSAFFSEDNYADAFVGSILTLESPFDSIPADQTTELVIGALRYMVMYMAILEKIYGAADECRVGGPEDTGESVLLVDQAVAFYVGSIEGASVAGRDGGQLLFATSKELCQFFDTCLPEDSSELNSSRIAAFRALRDQVNVGECAQANETIASEIAPLLIVPLVQGTLHSAATLDSPLSGVRDGIVGRGYAFSQSLLPLLDNADSSSALVVASNLGFRQPGGLVPDGAEAVFLAFQDIIPQMRVPDLSSKCTSLGVYQNAGYPELCDGLRTSAVPSISPTLVQPTPSNPNGEITVATSRISRLSEVSKLPRPSS